MNPSKFYYAVGDDKTVGPLSLNELRAWAAEGKIHTSTLVISEEGQEWETFAAVETRCGGESVKPVHIAVRRGNQTFGPYTISQAKEYLSEGRLRPADLAAMEGLGDWKPLAKLLTPLTKPPGPKFGLLPPLPHADTDVKHDESVECPKCISQVSSRAQVCPFCRFEVAQYAENLKEARMTLMDPVPYSAERKMNVVRAEYNQRSGCTTLSYLGIGAVIWILPVVGWILSPLFIFMGVVSLFSPVVGQRLINRMFSREEYDAIENKAADQARNTYTDIWCPFCCRRGGKTLSWSGPDGYYDCAECRMRSWRYGNRLIYLPHPDALPTPDIDAFLKATGRLRQL